MANLPSLTSLQIFDKGVAARFGSIYGVNRNDTINSVSFEFARVPLSMIINFGTTVTTAQTRKVRAAIWLVKAGWSVNRQPDFVSNNVYDPAALNVWTKDESTQVYTAVQFSFSNCQIKDADAVVIGIISEPQSAKTGQLCIRKNIAGNMYYSADLYPVGPLNATDGGQLTSTGSIFVKAIDITPYSNETKPTMPELKIKYVQSRTLSLDANSKSSSKTDLPRADIDSRKISADSPVNSHSAQWDTAYSPHPWADNDGYDFKQGRLNDVTYYSYNNVNSEPSNPSYPYWSFTRSRILFRFAGWSATGYSTLEYTVSGGSKNKVNVYKETKGRDTTLLICPRDEGITDCSVMTLTFTRKTYTDTGILRGVSKPITVYCQTYANPSVNIAYPKPLQTGGNYVLWATDVIPNIYKEDRAVTTQICSALNMLLSKDGGDNSGIPIFTRIYIAEYKGEYGKNDKYNGTFPTPSNEAIENSNVSYTASWRGIQLDDGTLFQLSGMKKDGFTWDDLVENDPNHPNHVVATANGNAKDNRLLFRAGYKYLIKVRRFHGAAAGALATYNSLNMIRSGAYNYETSLFGNVTYPGADLTKNYPTDTRTTWINKNNLGDAYSRWVGPADGSSGITLSNTDRLNIVYPGFSPSDHIIIDCVHSMTSRSNIIVTRPGTQEIGADHWLTFAYKHLNKTKTGVDISVYANTGVNSKQNEINQTTLKADGSVDPMPGLDNMCYGSTWSGYDNTATRISKMYHTIVKHVMGITSKVCDPYLNSLNSDTKRNHRWTGGYLTISVINSQGEPIAIYKDSSYKDDAEPKEAVPGTNSVWGDTIIDDYLKKNTYTPGTSIWQAFIFNNEKPNSANSASYGNTYKWYPVVAGTASDSSGSPPSLTGNSITDVNKLGELANGIYYKTNDKNSAKISGVYALAIEDKYQSWANVTAATGKEAPNIDGLAHWQEWNNSAESDEASDRDGHLFTSASAAFNTAISGNGNVINSSGEGGKQLFSQNSSNCNQQEPGKLFKRVSVLQDCENGNVNKNRRVLPCRADYYSPITRSTHFLFFQTYIYGQIHVELTLNYEYDEWKEETDENGEVYYEYVGVKNGSYTTTYGNVSGVANTILDNIGNTALYNGKALPHLLTVYGEDNGGLGRCLSADDSTALWYNNSGQISTVNSKSNPQLSGGIEIPLRVRFTPLIQPTVSTNETIVGTHKNRTTWSNNIISLRRSGGKVIESNSSNICANLVGKESLSVGISYGMYRSAMGGMYYSMPLFSNSNMQSQFQRLSTSTENVKATELLNPEIANTDMYPTVGICNAFMVLLYPTDLNEDYMHKEPNWYATRSNYENRALKSNSRVKPVIVADMAHDRGFIYKYLKDDALLSSDLIDHNLQTRFNCNFDYNTLLYTNTVISGTASVKNRKNKLQPQVWYDLVVVPIFTNKTGFGSDSWSGMDFKFDSTAGATVNGTLIGSNSDKEVAYYGSSPLVIKRFLQIAEIKTSSGGGSGESTTPEPDPDWVEPPFGIEPAIIFPNVNKVRYDLKAGKIKENPGFWLNNTFRVICRGPHFRSNDTINLSENQATSEVSLESISGGTLQGKIDEHKYEVSDVMIHIGKWDDYVYVKSINTDADGNEVVTFERDVDDKGNAYMFNSTEFTDLLNRNAMDKEWLNARGLYTMRTNPTAFSKCTPEAKRSGDERDVIYGGSLSSDDAEQYASRFFEFNPSIVDAHTCYSEGYYIQMRYLNAEYPSSAQGGMWSEWYGGLNNDDGYDNTTKKQHSDLDYYVPVRDYSKVFTQFRGLIKESTIGSNAHNYHKSSDSGTVTNSTIPGMGSLSENMAGIGEEISRNPFYISGEGNYHYEKGNDTSLSQKDTSIVPDKTLDEPYEQMINVIIEDGKNKGILDSPFKITNDVYNRHQQLWEMCYVDYIIRSMAKLYYSDWSEANIPQLGNYKLSPADIGWTKAMSYLHSSMLDISGNDKWRNQAWVDSVNKGLIISSMPTPKHFNNEIATWDVKSVITGITCDLTVSLSVPSSIIAKYALTYNGGIISNRVKIGSPVRVAAQALLANGRGIVLLNSNDQIICYATLESNGACLGPNESNLNDPPKNNLYNVNRYFRKDITTKDFDSLLNVMQNLTGFIREPKFTGTTTYSTDPTDYRGNGTGISVLPVSPEALDWTRLNTDKMIIGHSLNINDAGTVVGSSSNAVTKLTDSNYIQQLYEAITQKIAVPAIKILA